MTIWIYPLKMNDMCHVELHLNCHVTFKRDIFNVIILSNKTFFHLSILNAYPAKVLHDYSAISHCICNFIFITTNDGTVCVFPEKDS